MNESRCVDFLMQVFYQCYLSVDFFYSIQKLGVNFLNWPDRAYFDKAKEFYKICSDRGYPMALLEIKIEIPLETYKKLIGDEEIKIFYADYLNYLRSLELIKKLNFNPEAATRLCTEFLDNKATTATKINLHDAVNNFVLQNEDKLNSKIKNVNISAMPCLSKTIGGFNSGRVVVITAHTGFGKTNWGVNFLKEAIRDDKKSLYVNMEMDTVDMTKRFLQAEFSMNHSEFENENYIQKISTAQKINGLRNSWITDGSAMSISEISQMTSEIKRKQGLDFLVVDYDQKIVMDQYGSKEEWQLVRKAVEMLEALAKKESVCVIMFAQTNEENDGVPIASRRSMQPASAVIHFTKDGEQPILKFIKNRFGPTNEKIKLNYNPAKSLISEDGYYQEILPPPETKRRSYFNA